MSASTDTIDGYSSGYWSAGNPGGRAATRVILTQGCVNPQLALYQHPTADSTIGGSYYVMNEAGTVLAFTPYEYYGSCNDCWLPHPGRLSVTMDSGTYYWIAFHNGTMSDMSGPSIYVDADARTVGIATFDSPRWDIDSGAPRGLPASSATWQNRWRIDCE